MSKTFKSAKSLLELHIVRTNEDLVRFIICTEGESFASLDIHPATIPALALAILEAAGYTEGDKLAKNVARSHFGDAVESLAVGIVEQEYITSEAKEQAELEAEAFKLRRAYLEGRAGFDSWNELTDAERDHWLAVARKAREMRKS